MTRISRIPFAALALVAMLFISGCELLETAEPVKTPITHSEFTSKLASAKSTRPATAAERRLTELIDQNILTIDMKAEALFTRGSLRRMNGLNRQAAVKDFDDMLRLAPNHHLANNARIERGYVQNDIRVAAANRNTGRLQSLSQWFDAEWNGGDRAAAARRYQKSGLSPSSAQISKLVSAGYICRSGGSGGPVYKYGDRRSDLNNLKWCKSA